MAQKIAYIQVKDVYIHAFTNFKTFLADISIHENIAYRVRKNEASDTDLYIQLGTEFLELKVSILKETEDQETANRLYEKCRLWLLNALPFNF